MKGDQEKRFSEGDSRPEPQGWRMIKRLQNYPGEYSPKFLVDCFGDHEPRDGKQNFCHQPSQSLLERERVGTD